MTSLTVTDYNRPNRDSKGRNELMKNLSGQQNCAQTTFRGPEIKNNSAQSPPTFRTMWAIISESRLKMRFKIRRSSPRLFPDSGGQGVVLTIVGRM